MNTSAYISVHIQTQIIGPPIDISVLLGHTSKLNFMVTTDPSTSFDIDVSEYTCTSISPGGLPVIELPFALINVIANNVDNFLSRIIDIT